MQDSARKNGAIRYHLALSL